MYTSFDLVSLGAPPLWCDAMEFKILNVLHTGGQIQTTILINNY